MDSQTYNVKIGWFGDISLKDVTKILEIKYRKLISQLRSLGLYLLLRNRPHLPNDNYAGKKLTYIATMWSGILVLLSPKSKK